MPAETNIHKSFNFIFIKDLSYKNTHIKNIMLATITLEETTVKLLIFNSISLLINIPPPPQNIPDNIGRIGINFFIMK